MTQETLTGFPLFFPTGGLYKSESLIEKLPPLLQAPSENELVSPSNENVLASLWSVELESAELESLSAELESLQSGLQLAAHVDPMVL
jgi:hypothetical protein